jgi:HAD superfamily hydrolase (TIGR01509 family)
MSGLASQAGRDAPAQASGATEAPRIDAAAPVGGVVFDVPDVLYDATLWRRWLVQFVGRLGIRLGYAQFHRAWDAQLVDVHRGRREYAETLETFLLNLGLSWAQVDEIEAASRIQRQNLELAVRPLPGVARTIDELARLGLSLAAWADAPLVAGKLAERLERLLPHARFDAMLTSVELESTQPAPRCYQALLELLGLPAARTVYVGHDAAHLAGARSCGLRTVAFNHEPAAQADHYLTRFDDLATLAKSWSIVPRPRSAAYSSSRV